MTIEELNKLWDEFSEVPVDNNDGFEREFHGFKAGTDRMEVWSWFDRKGPSGLVKDLLGEKLGEVITKGEYCK